MRVKTLLPGLLTGLLAIVLLSSALTGDAKASAIDAEVDARVQQAAHFDAPQNEAPGGLSGDGIPPEIVSPLAVVGKGERSTSAVFDTAPRVHSFRLAAAARIARRAAPTARSTPLYLSHCAFLC